MLDIILQIGLRYLEIGAVLGFLLGFLMAIECIWDVLSSWEPKNWLYQILSILLAPFFIAAWIIPGAIVGVPVACATICSWIWIEYSRRKPIQPHLA